MVQFAAAQNSTQNMETSSWSKLEGAFKEFCEVRFGLACLACVDHDAD